MNERVPSPPSLFFKNARRQKRQTIVNLIRNLTARPIAFFRAIEIIGTGGPPREPYLPHMVSAGTDCPLAFLPVAMIILIGGQRSISTRVPLPFPS
jgi:hypothetical protein